MWPLISRCLVMRLATHLPTLHLPRLCPEDKRCNIGLSSHDSFAGFRCSPRRVTRRPTRGTRLYRSLGQSCCSCPAQLPARPALASKMSSESSHQRCQRRWQRLAGSAGMSVASLCSPSRSAKPSQASSCPPATASYCLSVNRPNEANPANRQKHRMRDTSADSGGHLPLLSRVRDACADSVQAGGKASIANAPGGTKVMSTWLN